MQIERVDTKEAAIKKQELLPELKRSLRIRNNNNFDPTLMLLLEAAIDHAESQTGCVFFQSEIIIREKNRGFSKAGFYPLQELISATRGAEDVADLVTLDEGRITCLEGRGELEVKFIAGYKELPKAVKAAIFLIATALFNQPADGVNMLPTQSTSFLRSYRRWQQ